MRSRRALATTPAGDFANLLPSVTDPSHTLRKILGTLRPVRSGACLVLVVLTAAIAAASARADGTPTDSTTTTTATTPPTGTTVTTAPPATTASTTPSYAPLAPVALASRCLGAGGVLVEAPGDGPLAFDAPAAALGASGYPSDASVVSFSGASGSGSACASGNVSLQNLSLFGGTVTAASVEATAGRGSASGLELNGSPLSLAAGETVAVGDWARLTLDGRLGRLSAPLVLRLVRSHGPLSAGTVLLVAFAEEAPPAVAGHTTKPKAAAPGKNGTTSAHAHAAVGHHSRHKHKARAPQPLEVTPPLGRGSYVFPVDGGASYVDTYGAGRSDIYDGWHHGDDLFAPLGTPVVAVARGTLSLVGWNELGGWRLWLTDKDGNSFYYAHLSGYARWILHHRHVKAGQVVGFLGRTGDAFTTTPHLHFEVHPHQLLRLGYDGAVDPTGYLHGWQVVHVPRKEMPRPARLVAPAGAPAQEAAVVWHELLVARHLARKAAPAPAPPPPFAILRPFPGNSPTAGRAAPLHLSGAVRVAARLAAPRDPGPWPPAVAAAVLAVGGFGLFAVGRRRRWIRG